MWQKLALFAALFYVLEGEKPVESVDTDIRYIPGDENIFMVIPKTCDMTMIPKMTMVIPKTCDMTMVIPKTCDMTMVILWLYRRHDTEDI